jgi:uncharacterized protein
MQTLPSYTTVPTFRNRLKVIGKAALFCIVFTALLVVFTMFKSYVPQQYERFAHGFAGIAAALLTTAVFLRIDKRTFASVGLRLEKATLGKFFAGLLIGVVLTALMFFCLVVFGNMKLELHTQGNTATFLLWTLALIPLALMEEIAFRAYPLVTVKEKAGLRTSVIVTAFLFAVYHIANGWNMDVSFLGPGIWGIVYGVAAVYSKGIALPTGIHYAANLVQSAIGMGKGFTPLFTLQQREELWSVHSSQLVGVIIQLLLLVVAVACMEWYRKKQLAAKATV